MTTADGGWTLRYNRKAEKDLARVDPPVARRILLALGDLADDPHRPGALRKLSGRTESRMRVGDWRVIVRLNAPAREIQVHRVLPRGRAYDR